MLVDVEKCVKCGRVRGERHKVTMRVPNDRTMERWVADGVAKATDGCKVEPDGTCRHGHLSWLLRLGVI